MKINHHGMCQLLDAIALRRIFGCPAIQNPPLRCAAADSEVLSTARDCKNSVPATFRESA